MGKLELVKTKKNVLIITDGSEKTAEMAAGIAAALGNCNVSLKSAPEFKGNDILPAEVFFIGCEKPEPDSFSYLSDLFGHINLIGRPCGVFSSGSEKTVKYLAGLVKGSEAALNTAGFLSGQGKDISQWAQTVASGA